MRVVPVLFLAVLTALPSYGEPDVTLQMTVGDESFYEGAQELPTETSYAADYGETITVGYEIENTGDVTLTVHDLVDSEVGTILSGFGFSLTPSASAWILQQILITEPVSIQGTWTAYNDGMTDLAADNDVVLVSLNEGALELVATVGPYSHFDNQTLPPTDFYLAAQDEPIAVGYEITNTGDSTFRLLDLSDTNQGTILSDFAFDLGPGTSVFVVLESVATGNLVFDATWSGRETVDATPTTAMDTAHVFINDPIHSADTDDSSAISLSELLRVIQFFNSAGLGCMVGTEDGYAPNGLDQSCASHDSDYAPQDWSVALSELLRLIQFFNSSAYYFCPVMLTEDGFCPGSP